MSNPNSAKDTKRKRSSELSFTEHSSSRRRITSSSSLPDISNLSAEMATNSDLSQPQNPSSSPLTPSSKVLSSASPDPENSGSSVSIVDSNGEIQTSTINELIVKAINSQAFIGAFAPLIASAITPHIQLIVQSCLQPILSSIKEQQKDIEDQNEEIKFLKQSNTDLKQRIEDLEYGLDNLEQYGRRPSLRFHNVPLPDPDEDVATDTDSTVIKICEGMGVTITPDDIDRSHPIGRPKQNKIQIICRFKNWKVKNKVYSAKKQLKNNANKIFVTEDLTKYRQSIVSKIIQAKNAKIIHSFWTYDGRIFLKFEQYGDRFEVTSLEELGNLING
ncbi:uncharacterized protein LOC133174018 [Saccostrea echinata]|uniref:uncharacterized protein LOC133174018 n=1 Tax=Saccostrea echinata TaxID=191078 RepID=UPI002A83D6C3|nr:uncharacterized protein LOC133174018 [Saccostrea echinata]